MSIESDHDLNDALERVGGEIQQIHDYVGRDFDRPCRIRFPRGYLRTATYFRNTLTFVADKTLRDNLSYALMLYDVQLWILLRTDLWGVPKEMVIKDAIMLLGNIAETFTKLPLSKSAAKKSYKKRTKALCSKGIIGAALRDDLDWLWDTRCNCHFFLVTMREYAHYTVQDYSRAIRTLRSFRHSLAQHFA